MEVLGHQGGWDEALLVVVPLLIFAVLLRVAKRRAEADGAGEPQRLDLPASRKRRVTADVDDDRPHRRLRGPDHDPLGDLPHAAPSSIGSGPVELVAVLGVAAELIDGDDGDPAASGGDQASGPKRRKRAHDGFP